MQILVNYSNTCEFHIFCLLCSFCFFLLLFLFFCFVFLFYFFLPRRIMFSDQHQEDAVFKHYVKLHYCVTFCFIYNIFCIHFQSSYPPVLNGIHVARSLIFCEVFCRSLFVLLSFFRLGIVLSVLLRFTCLFNTFIYIHN